MAYEQLDLNLLRVFDAIYAERNLTRAAMVLNVSQPAVSNALKRLREALNDALFVRERRGVVPTAYADNFAQSVHNALNLVRSELNSRERFSPERSQRTFRVSMNDPAEELFLPGLLSDVGKYAPGVTLLSNFIGRHVLTKEMALGAVDLAIDVPMGSDDRIRHEDLLNETYVCACRRGHPILRRKFTLDAYLSLDHIHVSARRRGLGFIDRSLADRQLARRIKLRTRNPKLAADIVASTDLAMSVPARMAASYDLAASPLPLDVPPITWRLYWPARADGDPGNKWLRQLILGRKAAEVPSASIRDSQSGKPKSPR
jgi:DNA-binding transcriptional LysR family regulator